MGAGDRLGGWPGYDGPMFQIPEGHSVRTFPGSEEPNLAPAPGGFVVATTGWGGDDQVAEIGELAEAVEALVRRADRRIVLSDLAGRLSELCAPNDVPVRQVECAVAWFFQPGSLEGWRQEPSRLLELSRWFQRVAVARGAQRPTPQWVFVEEGSREARVLGPIVRDLGAELRHPGPNGSVLIEVERPEGVTISVLGGESASLDPQGAPGSNDPPQGAVVALERSPRLHRLVIQAATAPSPTAWRALGEVLLQREAPLLYMGAQTPHGVRPLPMSWPRLGFALPVFPDMGAVRQTARDTGRPEGSYAVGGMAPRALLEWALENGYTLALNGFRDPKTPMYIPLRGGDLEELTSGRPPTWRPDVVPS